MSFAEEITIHSALKRLENQAAELTAARKVVAAAEMYHDVIIGRDNCPECEWYEGIGMKPCRILETLAEYNDVPFEEK